MALKFARLDSILVLWDIDPKGNNETLDMVKDTGGQGYCYTCDLSDREQVYNMAHKVRVQHLTLAGSGYN